MSQIKTAKDISQVIADFYASGKINSEQGLELTPLIEHIIHHHDLHSYYIDDLIIYNEQDIITKDGDILRPDRIVINQKNEAIIIDYKTGYEKPSHQQQILKYESVLKEMNFKVIKKILIYINDDIQVKEF